MTDRPDPRADAGPAGGPSLAAAVRFSVSGLIESLHVFLAMNLALVVGISIAVFALSLSSLAIGLVPFLAPLACATVRPAAAATREGSVALRTAAVGVRHRFWAKVGLAALQVLLLLLATFNLVVAPAIGGLVAAASMALSVYLIATILAYATCLWPLVCDPEREGRPLGAVLRLALAVLLRRPLQVLFLLAVFALAAVVVRNLVVPALFLPPMVVLMMTAYVLPAADELDPVS